MNQPDVSSQLDITLHVLFVTAQQFGRVALIAAGGGLTIVIMIAALSALVSVFTKKVRGHGKRTP